jgi:hypothetical protein
MGPVLDTPRGLGRFPAVGSITRYGATRWASRSYLASPSRSLASCCPPFVLAPREHGGEPFAVGRCEVRDYSGEFGQRVALVGDRPGGR